MQEMIMSRVWIVSQRKLRPEVSRCCVYEFEDIIYAIDDVTLISPEPRHRNLRSFSQKGIRYFEKFFDVSIRFDPVISETRLEGSTHLFFLIVQDPTDIVFLHKLTDWRKKCRVAVCWIEELWLSSLQWPAMLEPLKCFDHVILNCAQTAEELQRKISVPCHYVPPGIDSLAFCPYPFSPVRCIDVYYMGRRSVVAHTALLEAAKQNKLHYVFDTVKPEYVYDYQQHRFSLAERIKRTRYFVANRAKIDSPEQTQNQHEVGFRFFEGAAGGAILVGDPPQTDSFRSHFDWKDAFFSAAFDSSQILDVMESLDKEPERVAEARKNNVVNSLLKHDWLYRWESVLARAGIEPLASLYERKRRLEKLAEDIAKV